MLTIFVKLLKALNSEQSASQLAVAISLSVILGLTPLWSLHNIFIVLIALWFRVNLSLLIISYPLFALLGYLLSPSFETIGLAILQLPSLQEFWNSFFNTLIGRWSNFYYSAVMGSFFIGLVSALLLYPMTIWIIKIYRTKLLEKINQFKIMRMLKASKFWNLYSLHSESGHS